MKSLLMTGMNGKTKLLRYADCAFKRWVKAKD
jgi:hypothetical protein